MKQVMARVGAGARFRYFAYGSNLNVAQMSVRCPGAMTAGRATLPGWRMVFVGHSSYWGGGVATITEDPSTQVGVCGALYLLTEEDRRALDLLEGHPFWYRRESLMVWQGTTRLSAFTYVLRGQPPGLPSRRYLDQIARGYADHGISPDMLAFAENARNTEI